MKTDLNVVNVGSGEPKDRFATKSEPIQNQAEQTGPMGAVRIDMLMKSFNTASQLSDRGAAYRDRLEEEIGKSGTAQCIEPLTSDSFEGMLIVAKRQTGAILVIFAEAYNGRMDIPATYRIGEIYEQYVNPKYPGLKLLETVVVSSNDYDRVSKMATHIINTLKIENDPMFNAMNIESWAGGQYVISTNMNCVMNYVNSRSPHEISERADIGFIVYYLKNKTNNVTCHNGIPDQDHVPIMAVTGYTQFVSTTGAQFNATKAKFIPFVTITNIVSDILSKKLSGLALAIAADVFIKQNRWISPYNTFSKNAPNLGSLVKVDGVPWFAENMDARNEVISSCILNPCLALDVTEGRARISGIDAFVHKPEVAQMEVYNFLNIPIPTPMPPNPIVVKRWLEYTGETRLGAKIEDSRAVDYLSLITHGVKDSSKLEKFLHIPESPSERYFQIIETLGPETKLLYSNNHLVLDPNFITFIGASLLTGRMSIYYDAPGYGMNSNICDVLNMKANEFNNFAGLAAVVGNPYMNYRGMDPYGYR